MKVFAKKFGIVFITAALYCLPTQGMTIIGALSGGLAVSAALAPIIAPLAEKVATEAKANLPKVLEILSQKNQCSKACTTASSLLCRTQKGTSYCKGRCQQIMKVGGGYTLKIRYTNEWNILKCVNLAARKGKHTFKKGTNDKSIAIYGEDDFNLAMRTISKIAALDEFVLLNGQVPETKTKSDEDTKKLVQEAKEDSKRISDNFQVYVQENFGPQ